MENIYWKKTVGTLIGAIWIYTLAAIAGDIAGAVNGSGALLCFPVEAATFC